MSGPRKTRPPLPGRAGPRPDSDAMIRVDLAGEFGALRIYQGQLGVMERRGKSGAVAALRHMAAQEQTHFDAFTALARARAVRPTALEPLWNAAGAALGAATALMGEKAAMACTVAVEEIIDAHYGKQIAALGDGDPVLKTMIARFREDENAHRAEALARGAESAPFYPLLSAAIRLSCRLAIGLSERL
jgi:ubiquinone biosynthesis monooxygenase Coq7